MIWHNFVKQRKSFYHNKLFLPFCIQTGYFLTVSTIPLLEVFALGEDFSLYSSIK